MTAQLIRGSTETSDEVTESNGSSARAILGATLTFLALVALWELLEHFPYDVDHLVYPACLK
jgi:hypothetical protein